MSYSGDEMPMSEEKESMKELADLDGAKVPEFAQAEFEKKAGGLPDPSTDGAAATTSGAAQTGGATATTGGATYEPTTKQTPSAAQVLGVSEDQLQTEFNRFKADKLLKKVVMDLVYPNMSKDEIVKKVGEAVSYKLGGVTVLPDMLPAVLKSKTETDIYLAVCYPFGAETFETKKYLLKKARAKNVAGAVLCFDNYELSEKKPKAIIAEYKKLSGYFKKKTFTVAVDLDGMAIKDMLSVIEILYAAQIKSVRAMVSDLDKGSIALENFVKGADGKFEVTAATHSADPEKVVDVFAKGVSLFACANAVETAASFRELLNL